MANHGRYVGSRVNKLVDPPLLTGRGNFLDDISLPGQTYAAVVRSTYPHAKIKAISTESATMYPGVLRIVTGAEVRQFSKSISYMYGSKAWGAKEAVVYCLAVDTVRFVGEPVAAVVAEDKFSAKNAASLVEVEYEPLVPVLDAERALEPGAPLVYPPWGDNLLLKKRFVGGDVKKAFREADYVIKDTLKNHRYTGTPLEPRGYIADYNPVSNYLTFYASTQQPHPLRTELADVLNISENNVRVIQPSVGGGFGLKCPIYQEEILVALLSLLLRRPVKWVEERTENFLNGGHARQMTYNFQVGFNKDGRITGLKVRVMADVGAPSPLIGWGMAFVCAYHIPCVYKIENCDVELNIVSTNKAAWNAYRAYGKEGANFLMERVMDLVARKLNMDPADVRFKNFIQPNEFPFKHHSGATLDSGNYPAALKKALELANYEKLRGEQEKLRIERRYIGIGISYELTPEGACLPDSFILQYDGTTVRVGPTGKVSVLTGITSPGTGNETAIAQIVADELGVEIEDIAVVQGDTLVCPYGLGNFSGRSLLGGGSSALLAAREIKEKILRVAGNLLEASPRDLEARYGQIYVKGSSKHGVRFSDVATAVYRRPYDQAAGVEPGLESTRYWKMPNANHVPDDKGRITTYTSYPNAAHVAVVEVDTETGKVQVIKYVVVDDCGVIINPKIVDGQLTGGLMQGLGGVLYEELVYDQNGQLLTQTFMDYPIPTVMEMPDIVLAHQVTASPYTPLGAKGVGESGAVGAPAAIVNAVEDALTPFNVMIMETPLKPNRVWHAMKQAKGV